MRTARSLTVSRSICHARPLLPHTLPLPHHAQPPPTMHAPHHAHPPAMHTPLPCMPPGHTHTPPATHAPQPRMPPCHAAPPLPRMPPCHARPPCGQNSWHMLLKILLCPSFVAGGKNHSSDKRDKNEPKMVIILWLIVVHGIHDPVSTRDQLSRLLFLLHI